MTNFVMAQAIILHKRNAMAVVRTARSSNEMGRCEAGRTFDLETDDGLPVSICDRTATHTFTIKTLNARECTGKGIYHICPFHAECLKMKYDKLLQEENQITTCPTCGITHNDAILRYRIRKGI